MRIDLAGKGIGSTDESWWYLEHDDGADEFFLVHEWCKTSGLKVIPGEEKVAILAAKDEPYYCNAASVIREKFPHWKDVDKL